MLFADTNHIFSLTYTQKPPSYGTTQVNMYKIFQSLHPAETFEMQKKKKQNKGELCRERRNHRIWRKQNCIEMKWEGEKRREEKVQIFSKFRWTTFDKDDDEDEDGDVPSNLCWLRSSKTYFEAVRSRRICREESIFQDNLHTCAIDVSPHFTVCALVPSCILWPTLTHKFCGAHQPEVILLLWFIT